VRRHSLAAALALAPPPQPQPQTDSLATMAAVPKLTYWNFGGRAEPIRLAFFIGGVEFNDHRIAHADWPTLKPSTPFGGIPTLEVNGVTYGQSNAQLRYAGKLGGLYPADPVEALKVDELLDFVEVRRRRRRRRDGWCDGGMARARWRLIEWVMVMVMSLLLGDGRT